VSADRPPYGDSVRAGNPHMVRRTRKYHGYDSAGALANRCGVNQLTVWNIEAGRWTSIGVARRIAAALQVATGDMFDLATLGLVADGPAIRDAREAAGLSRLAVAHTVGMSDWTVSALESGERTLLWRDSAHLLAGALRVRVTDLFAEQEVAADLGAPVVRGRAAA
jgi:DNA-binding XRE family transcriptional regulator